MAEEKSAEKRFAFGAFSGCFGNKWKSGSVAVNVQTVLILLHYDGREIQFYQASLQRLLS